MHHEEESQPSPGAVLARFRRWRVRSGDELVVPNPKLKLMDQVREVMRLKHYSIRTERCYGDWIRRYVHYHRMRSREELFPGAAKVEEFLSDLAVNGQVAASTQNQAFNALLFLYAQVLHQPLDNVQAVRADRPARLPTVLTPAEVKAFVEAMVVVPQLVVRLSHLNAGRSPDPLSHTLTAIAGTRLNN